jgi:hypothetical protein
MPNYESAWRRRRWRLLAFVATLAVTFYALFRGVRFARAADLQTEVIASAAVFALFPVLVVYERLADFRCPRCLDRFAGRKLLGALYRRRCAACGLPRGMKQGSTW